MIELRVTPDLLNVRAAPEFRAVLLDYKIASKLSLSTAIKSTLKLRWKYTEQ